MPRADVVVVGGGAAGLAAAACLTRRGHAPVVLEREAQIGASWAGRYDRLRLHTVRRFSGLPGYPIPKAYGKYVPKDLYARYLAEYAARFRLDVRLEHQVDGVRRVDGRWAVVTPHAEWSARAVVVACGRHGRRRMPAVPGGETFRGRLLHTADYGSGRAYAGLRVLVVGLGNSGAEIAADLAEHGARVAVAVRTSPPITAREILGVPVQVLGIVLAPLPPRLVDRAGAVLRRTATGDLRPYGLAREAWGPFTARRPPLIDVGFLGRLKAGQIEIRGPLAGFTESGVVYADGSSEPFDVVMAATGFTTGLDELVDARVLDRAGMPRGVETAEGLYFIGYRETPRGALFETSRAAPSLARAVDRYLKEGLR